MSVESDFEQLLKRPRNYFKLSAQRQWEIDKALGVLDVDIPEHEITDDMRRRWEEYFK